MFDHVPHAAAGRKALNARPGAAAALARAIGDRCGAVACARPGGRNETLNRAAYVLARMTLRHGAAHRRGEIEERLLGAARVAGLPPSEARTTIASGTAGWLSGLCDWSGVGRPARVGRVEGYVAEITSLAYQGLASVRPA